MGYAKDSGSKLQMLSIWRGTFFFFFLSNINSIRKKERETSWYMKYTRNTENSQAWNVVPLCNLWTIWHERNSITFGGIEGTIQMIK
jgi:hypothetical protein